MRILLLGDHRNRDIPALSLIQTHLEKIDGALDVKIVSFDLLQQAIEYFKPHVVVLNHLFGKRNQGIAEVVRRRGGLVVVLPTEGRPNTQDRIIWSATQWPSYLCDLYLSWSDEFAKYLPLDVNTITTGCPRFDFYFSPLSNLIDRDETLSGLQINPDLPIVTIASSFPNGKFSKQGADFHKQDWEDLKMTTIPGHEDPNKFAGEEYKAYDMFRSWLFALREEMPRLQLILKPHPAESSWMWQPFCDDHGIQYLPMGYIWDLLSLSDLHLARTDCATVHEAWYLHLDTILFNTGNCGKDGPVRDVSMLAQEK